jgi:hypothetical protein
MRVPPERCRRREGAEVVLVAVNRGPDAKIGLDRSLGMPLGIYRGVLQDASAVNADNKLVVRDDGSATLHIGSLSSIVIRVSP